MNGFLENPIFLVAITFILFYFFGQLQKKTRWIFLNPILLTVSCLIVFLEAFDISFETYQQSGHLIEFWLKPAIVALGVPLYLQLERIKKQAVTLLFAELVGCATGIVSVAVIAKLMGASRSVILSIVPKSVTTPIAMEVAQSLGGIPSLTAAVVVGVGIFGAIFGFKILHLVGIESPIAQSLSMGTAAHAVGTSRAMDISSKYGAFASLGLILNGIFTAFFAPFIVDLLGLLD